MVKKGKRAKGGPGGKKKNRRWAAIVAVLVLGAAVTSYFLSGSEPAVQPGNSTNQTPTDPSSTSPGLRNRMILPAQPQTPRPFTLDPDSFPDPEVQRAYQVAREIPEVLEYMACYCGCYGSSGHRNNLDCFKDNHGVT